MAVAVDETGRDCEARAIDGLTGLRGKGAECGDSTVFDPNVGGDGRPAASIQDTASAEQGSHEAAGVSNSRVGAELRSTSDRVMASAARFTSAASCLEFSSRTCA